VAASLRVEPKVLKTEFPRVQDEHKVCTDNFVLQNRKQVIDSVNLINQLVKRNASGTLNLSKQEFDKILFNANYRYLDYIKKRVLDRNLEELIKVFQSEISKRLLGKYNDQILLYMIYTIDNTILKSF
jgi:hypothetical protein